ncbi:nuclear transport factor 2 family protein [Rhodococcus sp. NPDC127528]|uniref:nuclear transport factor 2 family protein n=1 Tax=unclassified Rhodococcus (in: high G+C Gram-positive bacteria) TaxID=192944 RepID=UPI003645A1CE
MKSYLEPPALSTGSLEDRLAVVEDTLAILRLEGAYSPSWDAGDAQAWSELFCEDGVFEVVAVGDAPEFVVRGRAELRRFCTEFTSHTSGIHLLNTPAIALDGDTASARVHFEFRSGFQSGAETRHAHVAGHYTVAYRRTAEGWRISHRREQAVRRDRGFFYSY